MSLLKKASIITTPTAYAEDYLYSIKPAYALSSELVTNGTFDTDSNWIKGTGWSISGGKANKTGSASDSLYQSGTFTQNKRYKLSFSLTNTTQGNLIGQLFGGGGSDEFFNTTSIANGNYTFEIKASINRTTFGFYASGSFDGSIDNVSVKEITDADFDFTRNSTGTRVNEDYLIEDVPYNFLTYSTDFTFWTQADTSTVQIEDSFDNSNNAYRVSIASGTGFQTIRKTGLNLSGQQTFSIYAKKDTLNFTRILFGGFGNFWVDLANGTQGTTTGSYDSITITNAGNGFFRIVATFTATSPVTHIYLYPSTANANVTQSSGSVIFQYAQLVKGDQPKDYLKTTDRLDIPRIDYTNGEPSILLEKSRTNILPYSEDFSNSNWMNQSTDTTLSVVSSGSPDGGAFYRCTSGSNGGGRIVDVFSGSLTGGVFSIYAKGSGSLQIDLFINGGGNVIKTITLSTEWKRYDVYNPHTNSSGDVSIRFFANSVADIFGAQVEAGSYATSYIPTSGSAVTRSADVANNAGNSDLISSTEGVLYGELSKPQLDNDAHLLIALINNGATTDQNTVTIGFDSDDDFFIRIKSSGSDILKYNSATSYPNQFYKIAVKYKSGDSSMYIDGKQVASSTNTFTFANTLNEINFNFDNNNGLPFYGNCKSIMVFKEALSDEELECLTGYNNHELYMNYYNRLSYLGLVEEYNVESDINNYIL